MLPSTYFTEKKPTRILATELSGPYFYSFGLSYLQILATSTLSLLQREDQFMSTRSLSSSSTNREHKKKWCSFLLF